MRKTKVKKHMRRTKKGPVPVREHRRKIYKKWRKLVNMTPAELKRFRETQEGKKAGLTKTKAKELGIKSGQESAEWILRMKPKARTFKSAEKNWSEKEWEWAKRQNSFNARMLGNKGPLYDEKGRLTRKHTSLLIWGHDPTKNRGALGPVEYAGLLKDKKVQDVPEWKFFMVKTFPEGDHMVAKIPKDTTNKKFKEYQDISAPESELQRLPFDDKSDLMAMKSTPKSRTIVQGFKDSLIDADVLFKKINKERNRGATVSGKMLDTIDDWYSKKSINEAFKMTKEKKSPLPQLDREDDFRLSSLTRTNHKKRIQRGEPITVTDVREEGRRQAQIGIDKDYMKVNSPRFKKGDKVKIKKGAKALEDKPISELTPAELDFLKKQGRHPKKIYIINLPKKTKDQEKAELAFRKLFGSFGWRLPNPHRSD